MIMSFILGMDTGGTYTDGVIIDSVTKEVLAKAKALTTKDDLTIGIKNCLENLGDFPWNEISLVSLSTTLATNAIVEGRGGKVGLLLFGDQLKDEELPTQYYKIIKGQFDIMGRLKEDMDEEEVRQAIESFRGKVDAIAISGYASVRNPKHEVRAAEIVKEILDLPIVCAHQLTTSLGFYHRTVTAVLNARLIPIIADLFAATKQVLSTKNITAPIMTVKGDGTLMTEFMAREKPIETILSGPAASIIGGSFLTGEKDAVILDMGGTTTDIAVIEKGIVKIKKEGAIVGGWRTRVQAAEISTFGLGGDSRIYLSKTGKLQIGPQKVIPLSIAGHKYPYLTHELKSFQRSGGEKKSYYDYESDCFLLVKNPPEDALSEKEKKIIARLQDGPHSSTILAASVGEDPEVVNFNRLVEEGYLARIALTPTDILHVLGRYNKWNYAVPKSGVEILARRMEIPEAMLLNQILKLIHDKLALVTIQSIANVDGKEFDYAQSEAAMYLIHHAFQSDSSAYLNFNIKLNKPIVAIGAPVSAWMEETAKRVNARVCIPEHAEVANAIGAAVGQLMEVIEILIQADTKNNQYILNTPWQRDVYHSLEEAQFYAIHEGRKYLQRLMKKAGCDTCEIIESYKESMFENEAMDVKAFSSAVLKLTAIGKPGVIAE